MDEQSQDKPYDVRDQLEAFVALQLGQRAMIYQDVEHNFSHGLVVHHVYDEALLFDLDGDAFEEAVHMVHHYFFVVFLLLFDKFKAIIVNWLFFFTKILVKIVIYNVYLLFEALFGRVLFLVINCRCLDFLNDWRLIGVVALESLLLHKIVVTLVVLDEDLDVGVTRDHIGRISNVVGTIPDVSAQRIDHF